MYIYIHVYIHTYIHIYTCIHTYTHTFTHKYINTQERNGKDDKQDKAELAAGVSSDYQQLQQQQKLAAKKNKAKKEKLVEVRMCISMSLYIFVHTLLSFNFQCKMLKLNLATKLFHVV